MSQSTPPGDDRTPPEELLEEIADQFSVYLRKGLAFDSAFQDIDPDLNITGLDDLLDLHFILSGEMLEVETRTRPDYVDVGVRDFLCLLPRRLRQLRTTTQRETQSFQGEVRGRVDWQETVKKRYRTGLPTNPIFACQLAEETVAIPENLVLWELLGHIDRAARESAEMVEDESITWFSSWRGESRLNRNLERAKSNVHLSELDIDRGERNPVPSRVVQNVLKSRAPLYTEAATLLQRYRRISNHELDPTEAKELLAQRLFAPAKRDKWGDDESPVFFELYWIFNLLKGFNAARRNLLTKKDENCVASWTDGSVEYDLYHDWSGGSELAFGESYFDRERERAVPGEDRYIGRMTELLRIQELESEGVFGQTRQRRKNRRPDFVLLRREGGAITDIALGEVKYTRKQSTAVTGLQELYRYMIFARESASLKPTYFTKGPEHFETPNVYGFLCVDRVETQREPAGNVSIVQTGEALDIPFGGSLEATQH